MPAISYTTSWDRIGSVKGIHVSDYKGRRILA